MARAPDRSKFQQALKNQDRFAAEHPEFMSAAREAMRPWEEGDELLLTMIGKAMLHAYNLGVKGTPPELQPIAKAEEPFVYDEPIDIPPSVPPELKAKLAKERADMAHANEVHRRTMVVQGDESPAERLRRLAAATAGKKTPAAPKETPAERLRRLTGR